MSLHTKLVTYATQIFSPSKQIMEGLCYYENSKKREVFVVKKTYVFQRI